MEKTGRSHLNQLTIFLSPILGQTDDICFCALCHRMIQDVNRLCLGLGKLSLSRYFSFWDRNLLWPRMVLNSQSPALASLPQSLVTSIPEGCSWLSELRLMPEGRWIQGGSYRGVSMLPKVEWSYLEEQIEKIPPTPNNPSLLAQPLYQHPTVLFALSHSPSPC